MDEKASAHLMEIQAQVTKLNGYLKVMLFCVVAVTITLISEVLRHW